MFNKINITESKKKLIVFMLLTTVTFAVYCQVNGFDFINYDDTVYVTDNSYVQSGFTLNGIRWAFSTKYFHLWTPLVWLSFMLDYQLHGLNAGAYHLINLVLHILSTLLLFWLFCRMTGAVWKSAFVAAVFALHPLHVESVAWIAERKDVLSAFFWMLTLCLYVYYTGKPNIKRYLLVLFCFVLALLSKPMVITLPVITILLDYWPLNRFESHKGNLLLWQLKEKIPFFVLSAVLVIVILCTPHEQKTYLKGFPLSSRLANAPVAFVTYLEKTFWPNDLSVLYPFPTQILTLQLIGASLLIILISVSVIAMKKRLSFLFVGWFWYSVALLPVIGIIQVGNNSMADRYMYLPSIGISIMLAWGIPFFFKSENMRKKILFPAAIVILIIFSVLTRQQCGYWKNSFTLFSHALQINEHNYQPHINNASYLTKEGKINEAINYYNKAIRIKPDQADAYNNRGIVYAKLGQYQLAIKDFNKAIALQPDNANIYTNRAIFYFDQGNKELGCKDAWMACRLGNCSILETARSNGYCR